MVVGTLWIVNPDSTVALLTAILRHAPSLPAAACRGQRQLFDDRHPNETTAARRNASTPRCCRAGAARYGRCCPPASWAWNSLDCGLSEGCVRCG
jgi:hypothetical protein